MDDRYSRHEGLFGAAGQRAIGEVLVAVIGFGGVGSIVATFLAYLGVTRFRVIEFDVVDWSSLNRHLGSAPGDVGELKLGTAERTIRVLHSDADLATAERFSDEDALAMLEAAQVVFGCVDSDVTRVEILGWASERGIPYIDAATDIGAHEDGTPWYGGRVIVSTGDGCPSCLDALDQEELRLAAMTPAQREDYARIYGVDVAALGKTGPSVVSLNGVVASLAVTEFMVMVTGLREPVRMLTYHAERGGVVIDRTEPVAGCPYCSTYRSRRSAA